MSIPVVVRWLLVMETAWERRESVGNGRAVLRDLGILIRFRFLEPHREEWGGAGVIEQDVELLAGQDASPASPSADEGVTAGDGLVGQSGIDGSDPSSPEANLKGFPARQWGLARRYRPSRLTDLVGQDAVVTTLTHALERDQLAHTILFTGVRGVGKTTTARILATSLNCLSHGSPNVEPCGSCQVCRDVSEGVDPDVRELDAASHNSVEQIRELIRSIGYQPHNRYRVFILDEVHVLSSTAFSVLLKTIEEPPPRVQFILATTELHSLPRTILSRCVIFNLRRVSLPTLIKHLTHICAQEGVGHRVAREALAMIAQAADGSVRDALSFLQHALTYNPDGVVSVEDVASILAVCTDVELWQLLSSLIERDPVGLIGHLRRLMDGGRPAPSVLNGLCGLIHRLTVRRALMDAAMRDGRDLVAVEPQSHENLQQDDENQSPVETLSEELRLSVQGLSVAELARWWKLLFDGRRTLLGAPDPQIALEMVLLQAVYTAAMPLPSDLLILREALASGSKNRQEGQGRSEEQGRSQQTDRNPPETARGSEELRRDQGSRETRKPPEDRSDQSVEGQERTGERGMGQQTDRNPPETARGSEEPRRDQGSRETRKPPEDRSDQSVEGQGRSEEQGRSQQTDRNPPETARGSEEPRRDQGSRETRKPPEDRSDQSVEGQERTGERGMGQQTDRNPPETARGSEEPRRDQGSRETRKPSEDRSDQSVEGQERTGERGMGQQTDRNPPETARGSEEPRRDQGSRETRKPSEDRSDQSVEGQERTGERGMGQQTDHNPSETARGSEEPRRDQGSRETRKPPEDRSDQSVEGQERTGEQGRSQQTDHTPPETAKGSEEPRRDQGWRETRKTQEDRSDQSVGVRGSGEQGRSQQTDRNPPETAKGSEEPRRDQGSRGKMKILQDLFPQSMVVEGGSEERAGSQEIDPSPSGGGHAALKD